VKLLLDLKRMVNRGEILAITGQNGVGKMSVFNFIDGLCRPQRAQEINNDNGELKLLK
jgi:ABC-type branched-subunit amino acid transport system ATPase component